MHQFGGYRAQGRDARSAQVLINDAAKLFEAGACGILTQNGFADVYNLAGGMTAWEQANLPVEK